MVDQLFNVEIEELTETAIRLARAGDGQMLRWIIDRASPPRRSRPIEIKGFRRIATVQDALAEMARLSELVAAGALTSEEAAGVAQLLREFITATDVADLAKRLESVEKAIEEARGLNTHRDPEWR